MHRRHCSKLAALTLTAAACGSGGGDITLSWQFVDGRGCVDAAVYQVQVASDEAAGAPVACALGEAPAAIAAFAPSSGGTLRLDARSFAGAILYSGTVDVPAHATGAFTVTLRYRGGP